MSIYLDVVWTSRQIVPLDQQSNSVRLIGEILPLVLSKHGIDQTAPAEPKQFGLQVR